MKNITFTFVAIAALAAIAAGPAAAVAVVAPVTPVAQSAYTLTAIDGRWAYGQTNYNAASSVGNVSNATDTAKVNTLLSNGYVALAGGGTVYNGVYSFPSAAISNNSLTFAFDGGADYLIDGFSFLTSRVLASGTSQHVIFEYSLDGGAWQTASDTTIGYYANATVETVSVSFAGVKADAFRLRLPGGSQVSLHELNLSGAAVSAVPEPATGVLAGLGVAALALVRRVRGRAV